MSDLLCKNNDFAISKYGDLVLTQNEDEEIMQIINNAILLRYGHNMFHTEFGNKVYSHRVKATDSGLHIIEEDCTNAISGCDSRIKQVVSVHASINDDGSGNCLVDYVVMYLPHESEEIAGADFEPYLRKVFSTITINAYNVGGGE